MRLKRDREARYACVPILPELATNPTNLFRVLDSKRSARKSRLVVHFPRSCVSRRIWSARTRRGKRRRRDSRSSCRSTTTRVSSTRCVKRRSDAKISLEADAAGIDQRYRTSTSSRSTTTLRRRHRPSPTSPPFPPSCRSATSARRIRPSTHTWPLRIRVGPVEGGESRRVLVAERAEAKMADVSCAAGLTCVSPSRSLRVLSLTIHSLQLKRDCPQLNEGASTSAAASGANSSAARTGGDAGWAARRPPPPSDDRFAPGGGNGRRGGIGYGRGDDDRRGGGGERRRSRSRERRDRSRSPPRYHDYDRSDERVKDRYGGRRGEDYSRSSGSRREDRDRDRDYRRRSRSRSRSPGRGDRGGYSGRERDERDRRDRDDKRRRLDY